MLRRFPQSAFDSPSGRGRRHMHTGADEELSNGLLAEAGEESLDVGAQIGIEGGVLVNGHGELHERVLAFLIEFFKPS